MNYVQHHIQGQKYKLLGQREDNNHRHLITKVRIMDSACQPPQRRPIDLTCHHLDAIRQENTAWKISQATNNDGDVFNDVLRGQTRLINYPHLSVVYLW